MDYSVRASDIPKEQAGFTDVWNLYKKYYKVQPDTDLAYWESVMKDVDECYKRHQSPLIAEQLAAVLHELERRKPKQ